MGPANRSRGRGRGSFRGGGRGRGRGRGRGGPARGPRPARFQGQRLDDNEESDEEAKPAFSEEEEDFDDASSDSDDEDTKPAARPYLALLQSFAAESEGPRAKKRKLSHPQNNDRAESPIPTKNDTEEEEEDESDEEDSDANSEALEPVDKDIDLVEEPEEGLADNDEDTGVQEQDLSDDEEDATDPFDSHFSNPDEQATSQRIIVIEKDGWETKRTSSTAARVFLTQPSGQQLQEVGFGSAAKLENLKLKQKLRESAAKKLARLDETQQQLAAVLFNYNDILFCNRNVKNGEGLRKLTCLHAINHIFKTRDRIIKNNNKLAKDGESNPELEFRDQGFTRPKVLFLVPTRNACLRIVNTIRDLSQPDQEENRKRFDDAFAVSGTPGENDKFGADKPDDFCDLFTGNDDDMFRIGVKFTRKTLKYYSQFYNSDILLASPLGLRMAIGADDGHRSKKQSAKLDYDFLSSVEIVVMDQADAMLMQNWEHVDFIFEHLNKQPRDAHGCDFSRVRSWYLDDHSKFFRQTVIFSAFNTPELSELVRTHCHNWAGKLRIQPPSYPGLISSLGGVNIKLRQTFSRFSAPSPAADPDARFNYFKTAVLPSLARRAADAVGTLIFIPSYLDFVRLRNYLANAHEVETLSFGTLSEYADVPSASRARSHFSTGRHKLLLYTERAHHFRRYKIRGVRRALFYGLPDNPTFYTDIAGSFMAASETDGTIEPGSGIVKAIFSKYDVLKLERIVGTERVGRMINDRGDTFDFL